MSDLFDNTLLTLNNSKETEVEFVPLVSAEDEEVTNKEVYPLFLAHIFNIMQRSSKINTLYDAKPQLFSTVFFHFLKYIYPISSIPLQNHELTNKNVNNNFTFSVFNFLDRDTRALPARFQDISGGKKNNLKNKSRLKNKTRRLKNNRKKHRKTIKKNKK